MNEIAKIIVARLEVANPHSGAVIGEFNFADPEIAKRQAEVYNSAGYITHVTNRLMINDDHLVPWHVPVLNNSTPS